MHGRARFACHRVHRARGVGKIGEAGAKRGQKREGWDAVSLSFHPGSFRSRNFFGKIPAKVATSFLLSDLLARGGDQMVEAPFVRARLAGTTMPTKNSFFPNENRSFSLRPATVSISFFSLSLFLPLSFLLPRWICVMADGLSSPLSHINARVRAY